MRVRHARSREPETTAGVVYAEPVRHVSTILAAASLAAFAAAGHVPQGPALAAGAPLAGTSAGEASASFAFSDVPPCHWAAGAVADVAGDGIFVGFPPDPGYDGVDALRQVFEGLRCGEPAWSLRFMSGAPDAFAARGGPVLVSYTLEPGIASVSADRAVLRFRLRAVVDRNGTQRTLTRRGTATATRTGAGWQVAYADLAALDLPFFPR